MKSAESADYFVEGLYYREIFSMMSTRASNSSAGYAEIEEAERIAALAPPARTKKRATSLNAAVAQKAGSPGQLVKDLMDKYYIVEDIAAQFAIMGVAVFLHLGEEAISELIMSNGGSAINVAMVLAARKDMARLLEEEKSLVVPAVQLVPVGGILQPLLAPVLPAAVTTAEALAAANALTDPYLLGEDEAGKLVIIKNFGVVGGLVSTECNRMPINTRRGETFKGSAVLYIAEISAELRTTFKEETVPRAQQWLSVFRFVCKKKWEPLGQKNWELSARAYMAEMVKGLGLEVAERLPFQQSVPLLNNIKNFGWAIDRSVFIDILAGNWNVNGVHISTFESSAGASRSASSTSDEVHRNSGLVTTLRNFMLYLGAYFHEVYLGTVEAIVREIEKSEFLYLMQGRLLIYIIDKLVGGVFRAVPVSASIEIGGVACSLEGPKFVAGAITAAALQVVSLFADRDAMRKEQIKLDEEASTNLANAKLIRRILEESPQKEKSEGLISASKRRRMEEEEAMLNTAKVVVKSEVVVPSAKKGGDDKGPRLTCVWNIAKQLSMLNAAGAEIHCAKTAKECFFTHAKLSDITISEAKKRTQQITDKFFRDNLRAKIKESRGMFKK